MPTLNPTFNPFPSQGGALISCLNAVISAPPASIPTLVASITTYINGAYFGGTAFTPAQAEEFNSIAFSAINSYRGHLLGTGNAGYNTNQMPFISGLFSITNNTAINAITQTIMDYEENIGTSGLSVPEQNPLFLATMAGNTVYQYLQLQISLGLGSAWAPYLTTNPAIDTANLSYWTVGTMYGSLAASNCTYLPLVSPSFDKVTFDLLASLIGSAAVISSIIIFKLVQVAAKPLTIAPQTVAGFDANVGSGRPTAATCAWQKTCPGNVHLCQASWNGGGPTICICPLSLDCTWIPNPSRCVYCQATTTPICIGTGNTNATGMI